MSDILKSYNLAFLFLFILVLATPMSSVDSTSMDVQTPDAPFTEAYTVHSPITINSDADVVSQSWPGAGTWAEPYVIEDFEIHTDDRCISISNTNVVILIKSCYLTSVGTSNSEGIYLNNVEGVIIEDCYIENKLQGVFASTTNDVIINGSIFDSNRENQIGFQASQNTTINNNVITGDCEFGIHLDSSSYNNVTNNVMWGCSVFTEGSSSTFWDITFDNNTVNGKPLQVYKDVVDTSVNCSDFSAVFLYNCDNVTLYDGNFSDVSVGICGGFSYYTNIENCTFLNTEKSVYLELCYYSNVTNCVSEEYQSNGIEVKSSRYLLIANNTLETSANWGTGIYAQIDHSFVSENNIRGGMYGIRVSTASVGNGTVRNNTITECLIWGVVVFGGSSTPVLIETNEISYNSGGGIFLWLSKNSTIRNNQIIGNDNDGIYSNVATGFDVSENHVVGNGGYGINLISNAPVNTTGALIYDNDIGWNQLGNAFDDGFSNSWDNGSLGNRWDDYPGSGTYAIPGIAGSIDYFPDTLIDSLPPDLTNPDDIVILTNDECTITWSVIEEHPLDYAIFRDGITVDYGHLPISKKVSIDVDTTTLGTFNYTLIVMDLAGSIATDEVMVEVVKYSPHAPISINSDAEFEAQALAEEWKGNGTESDPYIIEYYAIYSPGTSPAISITWISVTTYYIIRNCSVSGFDSLEENTGAIRLYQGNGVVSGCEIHNCTEGMYIQNIGKTIEYNTFWDCSEYALTGKSAYYAVVDGNTFDVKGTHAMFWQQCDNSIIENNQFLADITGGPTHQLEDQNTVNLTIRYNLIITSEGDFFLTSNDVLFHNNHVQVYDSYGLMLRHNQGFTVTDCIFEKVGGVSYSKGIFAAGPSSENIVIANSSFLGLGLTVWDIMNCSVYNCSIIDAYQESLDVEQMLGTTTIYNNTIRNSLYRGIFIDYRSVDVQVFDNIVDGISQGDGIQLRSNSSIVFNNTVYNCQTGIRAMFDGYANIIYSNYLYDNTDNAHDDGTENNWDNGTLGNYWSDYSGSGFYYIPGTGLGIDHFPLLLLELDPILISSPLDVWYVVGDTGNSINWTLLSGAPVYVQIYQNGTLIIQTDWIGENHLLNIDHLLVGTYNFTIKVTGSFQFYDTDTVWVTVAEEGTTSTTTTGSTTTSTLPTEYSEMIELFSLVIIIGSATIIIIIVVLIYKHRTLEQ